MPITPLHVGPGILLKLIEGPHLSLTMFTLTQITMDLEVVMRLMAGIYPLHGFTNTIIGATVVLIVTVALGKPVCEWVLRWWNRNLSPAQSRWMQVSERISWRAACLGGLLGVGSHFILDAIMHSDARPWAPFSEGNTFVGLLSIEQLNLLCLLCLLVGGIAIGIYGMIRGRRAKIRSSGRS